VVEYLHSPEINPQHCQKKSIRVGAAVSCILGRLEVGGSLEPTSSWEHNEMMAIKKKKKKRQGWGYINVRVLIVNAYHA
jgi:hypothetical protein